MICDTYLPDVNREFVGLSDTVALQAEIGAMRDQLATTYDQLALERQLASDVHRARSTAILGSPALRLVFEVEDNDSTKRQDLDIDSVFTSAFMQEVRTRQLPDGFAEFQAKRLRTELHPDAGGDTDTAKSIGGALDNTKADPTFSIISAILAAPSPTVTDAETLRLERYCLSLALEGAVPIFTNAELARKNAEVEINGAEWRVRANASFKTFELLIGDVDTWNSFLASIVRQGHSHLINLVNRLQPAILSIQERLVKGDPISAADLNTEAIDAIFERIWSTLKKKDNDALPYSPPYQNWLEVLLPALQMLDPGKKPGNDYTYFEPPIRFETAPQPRREYGRYGDDLSKIIFKKGSSQNTINYKTTW